MNSQLGVSIQLVQPQCFIQLQLRGYRAGIAFLIHPLRSEHLEDVKMFEPNLLLSCMYIMYAAILICWIDPIQ